MAYTVPHVRIEHADTVNVIKTLRPPAAAGGVELSDSGDLATILDVMAVRLTRIENQLELLLGQQMDDLK